MSIHDQYTCKTKIPVGELPGMDKIIECKDLCHSYGRKEVLRNLNFTVGPGRIFGLLGKNGAGKTTTINILMGFLQPVSGQCSIFDEPSHDIRPETRKKIGLLHEGHLQYDFMTVQQVERFYSGFYPRWRREVFFGLMEKMDMPHDRKLYRMSCGQRSQVALGLILAQDPELMILDDFSMGLDAGYRRLFLDYLKNYVQDSGKTVMVTSHIVQDLEKFVDDIIILDQGTVLVQSPLAEFRSGLRQFCFTLEQGKEKLRQDEVIKNHDVVGDRVSLFTFAEHAGVQEYLRGLGIDARDLEETDMSFEDAFIGVTGKY
jgi:ABC-2 type transport system ATP-binding protein